MQSPYRRLGATERAVWLRDRAIPLHFALTAQVQGILESKHLTHALHSLQQQHPLLRVKVALEPDGTPFFVEQVAPIPCRMVSRQGEMHWQQEVVWELSQPFDWTTAPLIRVVVIVDSVLDSAMVSELILVCHHVIADGMAGVNLIQEILSLLGNSSQGRGNQTMSFSLESLESLLSYYQPISTLQQVFGFGILKLQQVWQKMRQEVNSKFTANTPLPSKTCVQSGHLSAAVTAQLIHRCRQERTTVHAAICTAWLFAIAQQHHYSKKIVQCFSPINLRPYLVRQLEQECGIYIAPAQTKHIVTAQTQFWQTARSLKSDLTRQTQANHLLKLAHQHEVLISTNPRPEFVQHLFTQHCTSDVMVTNLGRLIMPQQYGDLVLRAIYGPMVLSGFEPERVCGVVTLGDRLFYTVVRQDSDAESMLVKQAIQTLERAIATSEMTQLTARLRLPENSTAQLQNV